MSDKDPDLHAAYALKTPEDSKRLYANWAKTYDADFVSVTGYRLHLLVADAFAGEGGTGPVLDVGAGTGVCGVALAARSVGPLDAMDVSAEMLEQASAKGVYRAAIEVDLTKPLSLPKATYAGIVSSGTFTTGHVGPDAIDALLDLAQPGALFALSVNAKHYERAGFAQKMDALAGKIGALTQKDVPIYGPEAKGPNAQDRALVLLFRKAGSSA